MWLHVCSLYTGKSEIYAVPFRYYSLGLCFCLFLKLDSTINLPSNSILFLVYFVNLVISNENTRLEFLVWLLLIVRQKCICVYPGVCCYIVSLMLGAPFSIA